MLFELCRELGVVHPDVLLRQLTSSQVADWIAYYQMWPWGDLREDLRYGAMMALLVNRLRGKGESPASPDQFITWQTKPDQTPDEIWNVLKGLNDADGSGS